MFNVQINFREGSAWKWSSNAREMKVIPRQGEMIWIAESKNWFRVDVVVHPVDIQDSDAILYVVDSGLNAVIFRHLEAELTV